MVEAHLTYALVSVTSFGIQLKQSFGELTEFVGIFEGASGNCQAFLGEYFGSVWLRPKYHTKPRDLPKLLCN